MALREHLLLLVTFTVIASTGLSMIQEDEGAFLRTATADETLELGMEFYRLESKISGLDESRAKDLKIKQLEKVIEEKSNLLLSLHNIECSLQAKLSSGVKGQLGVEDDRINEVEKQVINLKVEIDLQNKKKEELQLQVNLAEKRLEGMSLKLENLQNIKNEQRLKIHNTRHALHVTEEEMLKAKQETSSLAEQLKESFAISYWNEHGRPPFDSTVLKVLEKKTELEKWVHPHLKTFKTVRANLFKMLKSFEFTKPLATEGLVWFMSTVLLALALPVIILSRLLLRQEPKKHPRHSNRTNHGPKKSKRVHSHK